MDTKQKSKTTFFILVGMSTAFLLATPVIILLFMGLFLDKLFHTDPWLMIGGIIIGFIGGIANVYRLMMVIASKREMKQKTNKNQ